MLKEIKFRCSVFIAGGQLSPIEIVGPPDIHVWVEIYDVLETALICHQAVGLGAIINYKRKIDALHTRFGPMA